MLGSVQWRKPSKLGSAKENWQPNGMARLGQMLPFKSIGNKTKSETAEVDKGMKERFLGTTAVPADQAS